MEAIERRIEVLFGPEDVPIEDIDISRFVDSFIQTLQPRFVHRACQVAMDFEPTGLVRIPRQILEKGIEGLIRCAVDTDICPVDTEKCPRCRRNTVCHESGGTRVTLSFSPQAPPIRPTAGKHHPTSK